ncbi:hypothetical protein CC77DRAFT_47166 [Alternaria alternata]|uniref:Hydrophobin n=1 Tax=Alternaria alternata TaxID=5599 RepID=A0A177E3X0_ALTAL|nr:hypothetical protein CC77DRAFT_47166 [Alternaria alternata]OAG26416.1 hypothetical protein CC77DRAFT_47166 [Alternaria alternata]
MTLTPKLTQEIRAPTCLSASHKLNMRSTFSGTLSLLLFSHTSPSAQCASQYRCCSALNSSICLVNIVGTVPY